MTTGFVSESYLCAWTITTLNGLIPLTIFLQLKYGDNCTFRLEFY